MPTRSTWVLSAVATVLGLVYVWPTFSAGANGWSCLSERFGVPRGSRRPAGRAFAWAAIWLARRWGVMGAESGGDLWPVQATVAEAGLHLQVRHTFGRLAQPVLLPWAALEEVEPPESYGIGLQVQGGEILLGLRGALADAVEGQRRFQARRDTGRVQRPN